MNLILSLFFILLSFQPSLNLSLSKKENTLSEKLTNSLVRSSESETSLETSKNSEKFNNEKEITVSSSSSSFDSLSNKVETQVNDDEPKQYCGETLYYVVEYYCSFLKTESESDSLKSKRGISIGNHDQKISSRSTTGKMSFFNLIFIQYVLSLI